MLGERVLEDERRVLQDLSDLGEIVDRLLHLGGVSQPPVPDNLVALCDLTRGTIIAERPLGMARAVLQLDEEGCVIIVNDRLPRVAQRFSIFHEGYHILQRNGTFTPSSNGSTPRHYHEWLADQFAARVLMPRRWLTEIAKKTTDVRKLSGIFHVSQTAMGKRLKELGL